MRPLSILLLFFVLASPSDLFAQDWQVNKFRLCLRQDGPKDSGHAFLFRDLDDELACMRGFYVLDKSTELLSLRFPEAWYGVRKNDRVQWRLIPAISRLDEAPEVRFDFLQEEDQLILTHQPDSPIWFRDREDIFNGLELETGEILDMESSKDLKLNEQEFPPSLNSASSHTNLYDAKPSSVFGVELIVGRELLLKIAGPDNPLLGLAVLKLKQDDEDPFNGSAWLIHFECENDKELVAGRGSYKLRTSRDDNQAFDLELSFPKTYVHVGGSGVSSWRGDWRNETGIQIRIPRTDLAFRDVSPAYARKIFFIDKSGKRRRRFANQSILDDFFNGATELVPPPCLKINELASIELCSLAELQELDLLQSTELQKILIDSRPPGFRQSTIKKVVPRLRDAKLAISKGNRRAAVETLKELVVEDPDNAEARFNLVVSMKDGSVEERVEMFQQLIELEPEVSRYRMAFGELLAQGDVKKAMEQFKLAYKYADSIQQRVNACLVAANLLKDGGEHRKAFDFYIKAYSLAKGKSNTGSQMTWHFVKFGDESWPDDQCEEFIKNFEAGKLPRKDKFWNLRLAAAFKAAKLDFSEAVKLQAQVVKYHRGIPSKPSPAVLLRELYENKITYQDGMAYRLWLLADDKKTVHAKFESIEDGIIDLRKPNQTVIRILIEDLSEADQARIRKKLDEETQGIKD